MACGEEGERMGRMMEESSACAEGRRVLFWQLCKCWVLYSDCMRYAHATLNHFLTSSDGA